MGQTGEPGLALHRTEAALRGGSWEEDPLLPVWQHLETHAQPRLPTGLMCSRCSGDVLEAWDDTDSLGQLKLFPAFPLWHFGI